MVTADFLLPDLGEGLTESEIVAWRVAVGDRVELNQIIADVETAKAIVELPSPRAGIIERLYVSEGVTVNVGEPIVAFEVEAEAEVESVSEPADGLLPSEEAPPPNLVGYGAAVEPRSRLARRARTFNTEQKPSEALPLAGSTVRARATPPVRTLAKSAGVDLSMVNGTGRLGQITRADVEQAKQKAENDVARARTAMPTSTDHVRIPVKGVRKLTAEAMVRSAFTAPHVTIFTTVDVTRTTKLLSRAATTAPFRNVRLTFLAALARAVCIALEQHPEVNSRWDDATESVLQFDHVNLGIAAATPRGLIVPNIELADQLDLKHLASALSELVHVAREGKTMPSVLTGGTFTISNIGVFGVDSGTPILNDGQAAILALGVISPRPWEHKGRIRLREITTLSLSFDHRVLDGEQGAQFLMSVARLLNEPGIAFTAR
ncbi:MAG: branched-chain alpha-keto acid dehydrogenase subunit [Subtercola sp.]|nr:branched-chain alpha-keto acid dehydrogenase subunit [Subtercola sp.]